MLGKRWLGLMVMCCLLLAGASAAWAGGLKQKAASCFPPAPAGYTTEEVEFDDGLGGSLLAFLQQGNEVSRTYEGPEEVDVAIMGKGMQSFIFAAEGQNPGCKVIKVAGRTAVVMYDTDLAVLVGKKCVVLFSGENDWPQAQRAILPLAEKFDYNKLESLLE